MSQLRHQNNLLKISQYITIAPEGDYHVVLCPGELAPGFVRFANEQLAADDQFLDMGISGGDAILQSRASEPSLEALRNGFLQNLDSETVEAFLETHPQIGPHLSGHALISVRE